MTYIYNRKMKKCFIIFLLLLNTISVFSQNSKKDRIKSLKVAFFTEHIDLSAKEAQQFWPAYNKFEENLEAIRGEERETFSYIHDNIETMDESMAKKALESLETFEEDKIEAREKLLKELKSVLSYRKTLIFIRAEGDFNRNLLQILKGRKN